ncbi:ATP-binding protein [Pseudomonas arsenicoxydans]|nr:transporter substrate-binding domain-containing protein [Pseudomonas arsenicoxydans]
MLTRERFSRGLRASYWLVQLLLVCCFLWGRPVSALESVRLESDPALPRIEVNIEPTERQWLDSRRVVRLGTTALGYQPLELVRGESLRGITADYIAIIGSSLGLKVEVRVYPDWTTALAALTAGEVDVLGRGSSYEAQLPGMQLSTPYTENQPVLVGRGGDLGEGSALKEGRLAVVDGYVSLDELRMRFPNVQMDIYSTVREALHAVEYQNDRWLICDAVTVAYHLSLGELPSLRMRPFIGPKEQGYSFVFRANDYRLRSMFDRVLEGIPRLAQAEILGHWGVNSRFDSANVSVFSPEQLQWLAGRPEVRVAVSGGGPPYGFFDDDGEFRGLMADLLTEISQSTGLRFKMIEYPSAKDILQGLRIGAAEMTVMLLPTPERKEILQFTDSFASSSFALVTRRNTSIRRLADLHDQKVAMVEGSPPVSYMHERYPAVIPVLTADYIDTLVAVADSKAEAAILVLPISRYMINQYFPKDLRIVTSLAQIQANLSFGVVKNNPMLFDVMQAAVNHLEPRVVGNLVERWQNSLPAKTSVWGSYERRIRWFFLAGAGLIGLLVIWQGFAYYNRLRSRAEEARQAFRSALLDGIPESIVVRDLHGSFLFCNQAFYRTFDLQANEVVGRTWSEIGGLDSAQDEAQEQAYEALLQRNESLDVRQIELMVNGETFTFTQWAVPHHGNDGRIVGVLMGWIDVSATERLMRQLQEVRDQAVLASEAKSRFLAVMSHEIRTPLNAIIGLLELTMERVDRGEAWDRSAIEVAYSSSGSLMLLIGDILDLAKIESGKLTLEPQRSSPQEILESVERVFHGLARQKGLFLEANVQLDSAKDVMVDGGRLKQVLSNFVGNAIKFTDRGGVKLSLRTWEAGDNLCLVFLIEDTGIGISPVDQKSLFEPFSQVLGQSSQRGGTGLGLAICQQLVEMMGGSLMLDSAAGRGTRIKVELQVPSLEPEIAQPQQHSQETLQSLALRVLLVDDHLPNRLLLSQQLQFLGHSVHESEDGQQACDCLQVESFDVVITDCNMPVMNGYELTQWIRAQEREAGRERCVVIGFTANAQVEERQRCLAAGMDDCLFKPVSLAMLRTCLGQFEQHQVSSPVPVPEPVAANAPIVELSQFFDLDLIESLTEGNHQMIHVLLNELHTSNVADLNRLEQLLDTGKWRDMGQVVHRLKGAARMVGAKQLIEATRAYEEGLAKALDDDSARCRAIDVRDAVLQLQLAVVEWMSTSA